MREDDDHYLKGDEDNALHHYVQSAKLDKNMYKAISWIPNDSGEGYNLSEYVPTEKGKFNKELEYKENYLDLKNSEWRKYQTFCQDFFKVYMAFNSSEQRIGPNDWLYKYARKNEQNKFFGQMADALDELYKNPLSEEIMKKNINSKCDIFDFLKDSNYPECFEIFAKKYQQGLNGFFEYGFSYPYPKNLIPDFSKEKIVDAYQKNKINIEEYEVKSPEGDDLIFAMAYDEKGRVYIDNIYDPRVGMNDYGIPNQICQMGHLIYKPEDYQEQTFGIPEKYKKPGSNINYTDISAFWENIPMIKNFKQELIKRGSLPITKNTH